MKRQQTHTFLHRKCATEPLTSTKAALGPQRALKIHPSSAIESSPCFHNEKPRLDDKS